MCPRWGLAVAPHRKRGGRGWGAGQTVRHPPRRVRNDNSGERDDAGEGRGRRPPRAHGLAAATREDDDGGRVGDGGRRAALLPDWAWGQRAHWPEGPRGRRHRPDCRPSLWVCLSAGTTQRPGRVKGAPQADGWPRAGARNSLGGGVSWPRRLRGVSARPRGLAANRDDNGVRAADESHRPRITDYVELVSSIKVAPHRNILFKILSIMHVVFLRGHVCVIP